MEKINLILNYSFSQIDIENYINRFICERKAKLRHLSADFDYEDIPVGSPSVLVGIAYNLLGQVPEEPRIYKSRFNTYVFLCEALKGVLDTGVISIDDGGILNILQKKFEVNHRIFDFYTPKFKEIGESYTSIPVYTLFAVLLCLRYLIEQNLNDFNTTIKINDLILKSEWSFKACFNQLVCFSSRIEYRTLEELRGK